jgi:bleomycin hydrolase
MGKIYKSNYMKTNILRSITILLTLLFSFGLFAQINPIKYPTEVTVLKQNRSTSVKNQGNTGCCWDFAALSFIESEVLKSTGIEYDLSEMYVIRNAFPDKAGYYVRLHGNKSFSQGGQAHDVINAIRKYGIVPKEVYTGLKPGKNSYDHTLLEKNLKEKLDWAVKNMEKTRCTGYMEDVKMILDDDLGPAPQNFQYNGKIFTPLEYAKDLKLNLDDYIEITSYNHHPFYSKFMLEVPDNWSNEMYYNVPLNDLISIMEYVINNGYTIVWDGDVSEPGFSQTKGFAVLPYENAEVTQDDRQLEFETWLATDDHLMHIIGLAKDKDGKMYFLTKNSWGVTGKYGGYLYMSENYVRLKTICILINKNALPADIAAKIGLGSK